MRPPAQGTRPPAADAGRVALLTMLLVATSNRGKLREFRTLLPDIDLLTPDQIDLDLQVEETGSTFAANARLKARATHGMRWAAATGVSTRTP